MPLFFFKLKLSLLIFLTCLLCWPFISAQKCPITPFDDCQCISDESISDLFSIKCNAINQTQIPKFKPSTNDSNTTLSSINLLEISNSQFTTLSNSSFSTWSNTDILSLTLINNNIDEIGPNTFTTFNSLENLNLNQNNLKSVRFINDLKHLKTLILSENAIDLINSSTFSGGLTNLVMLDLSHNRITIIERDSFIDSPKLIELDLNNNLIASIDHYTFNGLSLLQILSLQHNKLVELGSLSIVGQHELDSSLDLSYQNLKSIEVNAIVDCSRLRSLELHHNQLKRLSRGFVRSLDALETLDLSNNFIETLIADNFGTLGQLNFINLDNNYISKIEAEAFVSLVRLERLLLNGNLIRDIGPNVFLNLLQLKELQLASNKLLTLNSGMFKDLINLETLYLINNYIVTIEDFTFKCLSNLITLVLNLNKLNTITVNMFVGLGNLLELDLNSNQIETIEANSFAHLPNLVYIDLGSNQLKNLHSQLFSGAFSLNTIFLQSNKLTEINTNNAGALFANLTNINILYLNDNRIVALPNSTFLGLESTLEELDISNNKLATHQTNSLKTLSNLKTLSLNNIDINPLQIAPLTAYAHLERLDLGNNVKLEIDNMTFVNLTKLKSLYLKNVGLKFVDNLHLNEMRKLNVLNLNGNDLDWTRFNRTNRLFQAYLPLTELYLSNTSLCELEILGLDQLNTLGILDLSSNRIEYIRSSVFEFKQVDKYGRGLLTMLNMANNLIRVIEAGSFTYLRGLSFLYLSQNMLNSHSDLDNINFGRFRWLYSLEFSNSNLTHFPLFSEVFPTKISYELTLLDLSRNKIETLSSSHFQLLQNLVSLDLENNRIGEVHVDDEGLFSTLTKLEILKLSQNRLDNTNLAKVKFANCINLKHLNLSYNHLKIVDNNLFSALKKLEIIDLSYNGLIEIEAYSFESMLALKSLYLNDDVSMGVVRLSDRFAHECDALKFVFVSSIEFVETNVEALIGSLKAVEAHKIVNGAVYYSSINIIVDNFDYYGRDERWSCKLTIFMLKAKIHVNLFSDIDFEVFLDNCYSLDLFDDEILGIKESIL